MGSQCRNPLPLTRMDAEAGRTERSGSGNRPSWYHVQVSSLQLRSLLHWTTRNIPIGSWWPELVQKLRIGRSCSGKKSHHLCRSCVHPPSLHREDSEGGVLDAVERWRRKASAGLAVVLTPCRHWGCFLVLILWPRHPNKWNSWS